MSYEVTIGIPVYNVEKYVRPMIESVLSQSFQSIEILVCDDCGTDASIDIIRHYQQTHTRGKDIRIVRQPQNGGLGRARNRIIDETSGKFLYFLDGDDTIAPNTIELLHKAAVEHQAEMVYGSYERIELFDGQTRRVPYQYPAISFEREDEFASFAYSSYDRLQCNQWNCLIDIDLFRRNNLRVQPVNYWEDLSFTLDLPTYVTRAVLLPDITYFYYCRYDSLSNFQQRDHIDKEEIVRTIQAVDQNKDNSERIRLKPYFPLRMYKLMMTNFYMVCSIMKQRKAIAPPFAKRELRDVMRSPLTFGQVMAFKQKKLACCMLWLMGKLPPSLSVAFIWTIGKLKKLV